MKLLFYWKINVKIISYRLKTVIEKFQIFDETQENRKWIYGSFLDYTLL